jgi:hypothetical protein
MTGHRAAGAVEPLAPSDTDTSACMWTAQDTP